MVRRGRNYFNLNESEQRTFSASTHKRVFISHKKEDRDVAKKVADYIMEAGIDVYFDEYDTTINRNDPKSVVAAIKRGMQLSTHMIVIFSNKTIKSTWVPWEIGYGDATSTEIAILKMIDIKKNQLPDYMQVAKVLYGTAGEFSVINYLKVCAEVALLSISTPIINRVSYFVFRKVL